MGEKRVLKNNGETQESPRQIEAVLNSCDYIVAEEVDSGHIHQLGKFKEGEERFIPWKATDFYCKLTNNLCIYSRNDERAGMMRIDISQIPNCNLPEEYNPEEIKEKVEVSDMT